jgi:hypothetical protein
VAVVPSSSRGTAPVTSVFTRTGDVVAASSDYSDAQVANSPTNKLTTTGDLLYASAANTLARLGVGSSLQALIVSGGLPAWAASPQSVLTTTGDIIYASSANTLARLAVGTAAQVLVGGTTPAWGAGPLGGVGWTVITKAIDTSRNTTTTIAADPELAATLVSGGLYEVELYVIFVSASGGGTPDIKMGFAEDATSRGAWFISYLNAADSPALSNQACNNSASVACGTATTNRSAFMRAVYWAAGGSAALYWAQNTSDANDTTVKAGSVMRYRRIL